MTSLKMMLGVSLLATWAGCTDNHGVNNSDGACPFSAGGQCGYAANVGDLPEGGELRVGHTFIADGAHGVGTQGVSELETYLVSSASLALYPPVGMCTDLRGGQYWPVSVLDPSAVARDLGPSVTIDSPTGAITLPECTTATNGGRPCATYGARTVDIAYGGADAGSPPGAFEESVSVQPGADYTLVGLKADDNSDLVVHVPPSSDLQSGLGSTSLTFAAGQDLSLTWTPPAQEDSVRTYRTHFARLYVLDTTSSNQGNPLAWVCGPTQDAAGWEIDGSITVPQEVVAQWPSTGGLAVLTEMTFDRKAVDGYGFDLIGSWTYISPFTIQ